MLGKNVFFIKKIKKILLISTINKGFYFLYIILTKNYRNNKLKKNSITDRAKPRIYINIFIIYKLIRIIQVT